MVSTVLYGNDFRSILYVVWNLVPDNHVFTRQIQHGTRITEESKRKGKDNQENIATVPTLAVPCDRGYLGYVHFVHWFVGLSFSIFLFFMFVSIGDPLPGRQRRPEFGRSIVHLVVPLEAIVGSCLRVVRVEPEALRVVS